MPDQSSHRLRIPPAFISNFDGVLPSNSIIRNAEQRSWLVEVTNVNGTLYFQNGWEVFVQQNSLVLGDFLVFCYGGNSEFCVKIYGKDGCQKEVASASTNDSMKLSLQRTFKPGRRKQLVHEDSDKETCLQNVSAIPEDDRAIEAARKFVPKNPYFRAVIHPAYLKSGTLNVPSEFVRRHVHKCKQYVMLRLSGKSWPVKLVRYKSAVAKFCTGWCEFAKDNTINVGDVCVFELIEKDDFVLQVSIFRSLD